MESRTGRPVESTQRGSVDRRLPLRIAVLAGGLSAVLAVSTGCAGEPAPEQDAGAGFPMTVSDCGRKVVLEERPERVLTSGSSASTLMWAAGAADRVTTRSAEGGAPLGPAAKAYENVPEISPADDLSREAIIGQSPDLVISAGLNLVTAEELEATGIHSLVNAGFCDGTGSGKNPDGDIDFDDVYSDIRLYGKIFGTQDEANAKVAELKRRVAKVHAGEREEGVKTAAAVIVDDTKVTAYGRQSMTHAQIRALGLRNVFGDLDARINEVSAEALIDRDPDVVIALYGGQGVGPRSERQVEQNLRGLPGASNIDAVRSGRVVALEAPYLLASPLAVDGLERIDSEVRKA